jgi:hypothetical protein
MNYYRAIPVGKRPSPADQAASLAKHRAIFQRGAPAGLKEALAEHGLKLPPSDASHFAGNVLMYALVFAGLGMVWAIVGLKGRD